MRADEEDARSRVICVLQHLSELQSKGGKERERVALVDVSRTKTRVVEKAAVSRTLGPILLEVVRAQIG